MVWSLGTALAERGYLPDAIIGAGIRGMLRGRLATSAREVDTGAQAAFIEEARRGPIAIHPEKANEQHYTLPPAFFERTLGARMKYSCCLYPGGGETLEQAEEAMLALTCERAGVADGMRVLDLGCGWGALSLWIAEQYPGASVLAVSNSPDQRQAIEARAAAKGLTNLHVETHDINDFAPEETFDRMVSVEMLEHVRNHAALFERIAGWLAPQGRLFVHVFCHREYCYPYVAEEDGNWMARYFFTGGMMPSYDLLPSTDQHMECEERWEVNGQHYARTCRQWLERYDQQRPAIDPILRDVYGANATLWRQRWRLFYLACAELFAYRGGDEWFVAHYRFRTRS